MATFIVALLRKCLLPLISLRDNFPGTERALRPRIEYVIDNPKEGCMTGVRFGGASTCRSAHRFKQRSRALSSPQWTQVVPKIPYTLFLRFQ